MPDVPGCVIKSTSVRFLTKARGCSTSAPTAICCSEAVNDFIKSWGFFSALCVFIRHSPTGRYSWSALRWDRGRTNKHGRPASPHMQMCPRLLSQTHLSCLPSAARGGEPRRVHVKHTHMQTTHKQRLSEPQQKGETQHRQICQRLRLGLPSSHRGSRCGVGRRKKTTTSAYWFWHSLRFAGAGVRL